jgi:hypothetical protein
MPRGTTVMDVGLKELVGLTTLQTLDLRFTRVTDAGVKELRKALPGVHDISRGCAHREPAEVDRLHDSLRAWSDYRGIDSGDCVLTIEA